MQKVREESISQQSLCLDSPTAPAPRKTRTPRTRQDDEKASIAQTAQADYEAFAAEMDAAAKLRKKVKQEMTFENILRRSYGRMPRGQRKVTPMTRASSLRSIFDV